METFQLRRSGKAPLIFQGERLATARRDDIPGPLRGHRKYRRAYEVTVYQTDDARLVWSVHYDAKTTVEFDHDAAGVAESVLDLELQLRHHDPLAYTDGGLARTEGATRHLLRERLRAAYRSAVAEVLDQLGDRFAEERDAVLAEALAVPWFVVAEAKPDDPGHSRCLVLTQEGTWRPLTALLRPPSGALIFRNAAEAEAAAYAARALAGDPTIHPWTYEVR